MEPVSEIPEGFNPDQQVVTTFGDIMTYAADAWEKGYETAILDWGSRDQDLGTPNPYVQHETIEIEVSE